MVKSTPTASNSSGCPSDADPELEPAFGDLIDRRRHLGQQDRGAERRRYEDSGREAKLRGARGDCSEHSQRFHPLRVLREVHRRVGIPVEAVAEDDVVADDDTVEARIL